MRQRREDVPSLAEHFLKLYSRDTKRRFRGITEAAMKCLATYSWPGNVRELGNAIERAVVLGDSDWIEREDLPAHVVDGKSGGGKTDMDEDLPYHQAVEAFKRRLILSSLEKTDGNQSRAAQMLDLQRTYLARLITNLNLRNDLK